MARNYNLMDGKPNASAPKPRYDFSQVQKELEKLRADIAKKQEAVKASKVAKEKTRPSRPADDVDDAPRRSRRSDGDRGTRDADDADPTRSTAYDDDDDDNDDRRPPRRRRPRKVDYDYDDDEDYPDDYQDRRPWAAGSEGLPRQPYVDPYEEDYNKTSEDLSLDFNDPLKYWILDGRLDNLGESSKLAMLPQSRKELMMKQRTRNDPNGQLIKPGGDADLIDGADPLKAWILNGRKDDLSEVDANVKLPLSTYVGQRPPLVDTPDNGLFPIDNSADGRNREYNFILEDKELKGWILNGREDDLKKSTDIIRLPRIPQSNGFSTVKPTGKFYGFDA